jgi:hypothetical protein
MTEKIKIKKNKKTPKKKQDSEESKLEKEVEEDKLSEIVRVIRQHNPQVKINEDVITDALSGGEIISPALSIISEPAPVKLEREAKVFVPKKNVFEREENEEEKNKIKYEIGYAEKNYKEIDEDREKIIREQLLVREKRITPFDERTADIRPRFNQNFVINPELEELRRTQQGRLEKDYVARAKKEDNEMFSPFETNQKKYDFRKKD